MQGSGVGDQWAWAPKLFFEQVRGAGGVQMGWVWWLVGWDVCGVRTVAIQGGGVEDQWGLAGAMSFGVRECLWVAQ